MKKMKRFFALFLAMAMVLGMSMTTFAASATITVNNADGAELTWVQIIKPDTSKPSGWAIVDGFLPAFQDENAFGNIGEQEIIWKMILLKDSTAKVPAGTTAAQASQIEKALSKVTGYGSTNVDNTSHTISVDDAGVYAIKATDTTNKYSYSPMSAYVSFGVYDTENDELSLRPATVNAKRIPLSLQKESSEEDKVVYVGKDVNYTITTTVPYILDGNSYTITDTISGATYNATSGNLTLKVMVNGEEKKKADGSDYVASVNDTTVQKDGKDIPAQTFTIDLSEIAQDENLRNESLTIEYSAHVTGVEVNNTATLNDGTNTNFGKVTDTLYAGTLTILKTDDSETPVALANAEFVVYTVRNNVRQYAVIEDGKVTSWVAGSVDDNEQQVVPATATQIKTGVDGTVTVQGFDDSETYYFKEVVAPEGYSINSKDEVAIWDSEGAGAVAATRAGNATMTDTTLSALPSTGGIGTTIFTVGGCAIMILAAGMFFASRKRASR